MYRFGKNGTNRLCHCIQDGLHLRKMGYYAIVTGPVLLLAIEGAAVI